MRAKKSSPLGTTIEVDGANAPGHSCGHVSTGGGIHIPRLMTSTCGREALWKTKLEALWRVFRSDDKVLIIISADPDSIASVVALKRLLWRRVGQVVVAATNQIKRPDNLRLVESLNLKLESLTNLDLASFSSLVVVDSQPSHSPLTKDLPFDVIIDHHPATCVNPGLPGPGYVEIRPELGSTATILTFLLKAAKIKPNKTLATALFYALKTDTHNFVRQGQLDDMKAFRWLYPLIHPQLLSDIERAPIAKSSFKTIVAGLGQAVFQKTTVHTFLEKVDHPDTLVILADFLLQIKEVNRSTVAGICGPKLVVIFRSGSSRLDVGALAAKAFGDYGSAGGHKSMARAEIPLENLEAKLRNNPSALGRFVLRRLMGDEVGKA